LYALKAEVGHAGTAPTRLNFVGNEGDAVFVQDLLDAHEVIRRRGDEAADALDRLGDEGGRIAAGGRTDDRIHVASAKQIAAGIGLFPGAAVAVRIAYVMDVERREGARSPGTVAGSIDGGERAAVVAVTQRDQFVAVAVERRDQKSGFVRLGTAVGKEDLIEFGWGHRANPLGKFDLGTDEEEG